MTDEWFHKRTGEQGTGYGIKSRGGVIASVVFIILATAVVIAASEAVRRWHTPPFPTVLAAIVGEVILIIAFVALVRARSDAR